MSVQVCSADEVARLVEDGDTILIGGSGGGLPGGGDADDEFESYCRPPRFRSIRTSLMTVFSVSRVFRSWPSCGSDAMVW